MDAPAHDGLLHGEAGHDRGERENESGTHHREVPLWLGRREEALQVLGGGGGSSDPVRGRSGGHHVLSRRNYLTSGSP